MGSNSYMLCSPSGEASWFDEILRSSCKGTRIVSVSFECTLAAQLEFPKTLQTQPIPMNCCKPGWNFCSLYVHQESLCCDSKMLEGLPGPVEI